LAPTPPPTGPAAITSPPPTIVATPSPTTSATSTPVLAGHPCDRIWALARAEDGWMVRCLPTRYHQLRWKIV
jgi:hypothetical protein